MKIKIYPIKSLLSYGDRNKTINNESAELIEDLRKRTNFEYELEEDLDKLNDSDMALILVQSGGSEGFFKKDIFPKFDGPYYLLTYGSSNSLAASLEILSFIKNNNKKGEVLHGDNSYIANRIIELSSKKIINKNIRLGVFGKPSDWLISSDVDYKKALDIFNISLIDVTEEEVIDTIKNINEVAPKGLFNAKFNSDEINKAYSIYVGLKKLVNKYELTGFTLRCFDVIKAVNSSACLALAMLNKENIIATCEGDVPSMISALVIRNVLNLHSFQANPNWIDPINNNITFAHCTLPLDMVKKYTFDTHFESGIGIGIHGEFELKEITILKISASLNEFYLSTGKITNNEYRKDRCRSQIIINLDSTVKYFLRSSLGNHHLIFYGNHKNELKDYLEKLGLREVI